jgi:hypothetical protein
LKVVREENVPFSIKKLSDALSYSLPESLRFGEGAENEAVIEV